MTERKKTLALFTEIRCATRCGGKGHFARNCGTPDPRGKGKGKGKARTARVALNNRPGVPGTPSFASAATRKDTLRRSAGRRNVRRTVTG